MWGGGWRGGGVPKHIYLKFSFCSDSRVPRKRSARRTGSVWQPKYNIRCPAWRVRMPSKGGGVYTGDLYTAANTCTSE